MINQAIQEAEKMQLQMQALYDCEGYSQEYVDTLQEFIERLKKLPQEDGWISVEDRLPEDSGIYLGYWKKRGTEFNGLVDYDGEEMTDSVTHWANITYPLPPKP